MILKYKNALKIILKREKLIYNIEENENNRYNVLIKNLSFI